jgi:hypothetical protein
MWNIFKFFFVWFWLGLASFVVVVLIAPKPEPRIELVRGKQVSIPQSSGAGVVGLFLGFTMCIPSYFIARPKNVGSGGLQERA